MPEADDGCRAVKRVVTGHARGQFGRDSPGINPANRDNARHNCGLPSPIRTPRVRGLPNPAAFASRICALPASHVGAACAVNLPPPHPQPNHHESVPQKTHQAIVAEAHTGEGDAVPALKRTLGAWQLITARHRRGDRRGPVFADRQGGGRQRRPRGGVFLHDQRAGLCLRRLVLRGVRLHGAGGRQRVFLFLCHHGRIAGVDHRLGPGHGIRHRRGHRGGELVGLFREILQATRHGLSRVQFALSPFDTEILANGRRSTASPTCPPR